MHKPWDDNQLPKRKFDEYLPFVPSQKETFEFIRTIPDIKQKAMVAVMYSSGLRIGEVCHLRYEDINRNTMKVHICKSKNRQERFAPLSKFALDILTMYWFDCGRPKEWLFPKQTDPSRPIDTFFLSRHIHEHEELSGLSMNEVLLKVWNYDIKACPVCGCCNSMHPGGRTYAMRN